MTAPAPDTRLLDIDPGSFDKNFGQSPMAIKHRLLDDPRMTLDSLAGLAARHPARHLEHNQGDVSEIAAAVDAKTTNLSPEEIVRTIDTNGVWMVIKNIELDRAYKALMDELLDEVEPAVSGHEGGMRRREAFIFISAPHSTTPSHTDPEHNFLLQVRGRKQMVVGRYPDETTKQREVEKLSAGGHRNIDFKPAEPQTFDLEPGDGVYVFPHAPHLVRNGPQPSISLSITWRTLATERDRRTHIVNHALRRMRLDPPPPGRRPRIDAAKAETLRMATEARKKLRRTE